MRYLFIAFCTFLFLSACSRSNNKLIGRQFADSLQKNYHPSNELATTQSELKFWKARINPHRPGIANELKYASLLVHRFHLLGNIKDLDSAEQIIWAVNHTYQGKESAVFTALTEISLLRHRFPDADKFLKEAKSIGIESYLSNSLSFDVEFELGHYNLATFYAEKLKSPVDYGYLFRRAKLFHLNSQADSALSYMLKAANVVPKNSYLHNVALANSADFYIHTGELGKAADAFKRCIRINGNDIHSISGLGTIAMKNDADWSSAKKLFGLVNNNYKLPDGEFKLYQLAQAQNNQKLEKQYAEKFASQASEPAYGKMYNKYLVEIFTGILNKPAIAETLSREELKNRLTPQTAAWYAWSLYKNGKKNEAYTVYKKSVSGKPLEGLELFYMGEMMRGLKKGYTANQYFEAAKANKFDLSPRMIKELDKL